MKKKFIVEIDYEETNGNSNQKADVFYDSALEATIENLMFEYKESGYVKDGFKVEVKEI